MSHSAVQASEKNKGAETLFAEAIEPRGNFGDWVLFIIAGAFVFGSFYLMSLAPTHEEYAIELFIGGILGDALGLWLAFGVIPNWRAKRADRS